MPSSSCPITRLRRASQTCTAITRLIKSWSRVQRFATHLAQHSRSAATHLVCENACCWIFFPDTKTFELIIFFWNLTFFCWAGSFGGASLPCEWDYLSTTFPGCVCVCVFKIFIFFQLILSFSFFFTPAVSERTCSPCSWRAYSTLLLSSLLTMDCWGNFLSFFRWAIRYLFLYFASLSLSLSLSLSFVLIIRSSSAALRNHTLLPRSTKMLLPRKIAFRSRTFPGFTTQVSIQRKNKIKKYWKRLSSCFPLNPSAATKTTTTMRSSWGLPMW